MLNRVRQVWSAINARVTPADEYFVRQHLRERELALFWAMSLPDRRHVLNVAYTAIRLAEGSESLDGKLLIRCALLHDVGRQNGDVSTIDKIIAVLLHKLLPRAAKTLAREGRGGRVANLRHALYVYFNHPQRSAALLQTAGAEEILIAIVARHHKAPADGDPTELVLLRQADGLN